MDDRTLCVFVSVFVSVSMPRLVVVLFFVANRLYVQYQHGETPNERGAEYAIRWMAIVRGVLSIYTIACGLYIAASLIRKWGLPAIGEDWLPGWPWWGSG